MENRDVLLDLYRQNKAAMFVGNHNSWMDIPFIGATIGWRNYKFVAKKELEKVPILGKSIMCAKNVCVDRADRRSQIQTLKAGMNWLKVRLISVRVRGKGHGAWISFWLTDFTLAHVCIYLILTIISQIDVSLHL
jgi:1-acyl-sn-glycerol-3-phosphate acyltransferase